MPICEKANHSNNSFNRFMISKKDYKIRLKMKRQKALPGIRINPGWCVVNTAEQQGLADEWLST